MNVRGALVAVLVLAGSIGGVATVQPSTARRVRDVKGKDDVYALPPPETIKAVSLGYDSAGADLLWAKLLLEYGSHWAEHKYFREAARFVDDIIALDPRHHALYTFVDAILVYQPTDANKSRGDANDARDARRFLEKGTEAFPYDGDLWMHYGQFIAFVGPTFLSDPAEQDRWKVDGAKAMGHAMDLGVRVEFTMAAASVLGRKGESKAAIAYLKRAYALSDDPKERENIELQLQKYEESALEDEGVRTLRTVERTWRGSFPYLTREQFLLLSPAPNPAACAGRDRARDVECFFSWSDVNERIER